MDFVDYYKILELDKAANDADIKKAYRKLARKYHPDLNPNDNAAKLKFQQVNEANEVLSDPEKRKKYDSHGKDWKHAEQFERAGTQRTSPSDGSSTYSGFESGSFSDFFESMFGGGRGGSGRKTQFRGEDLNAELHLTLNDVYHTQKQTISVNGKSIRLTIPAGVENEQTIKIPGHGESGANGGPAGDLFITFLITNPTKFKRDGDNLHVDVQLGLYKALLGGDVLVDTFNGQVKLTIKPETKNETKVRLKGKGFPVYKKESEFGDLIITYKIAMPTQLTDREKELFKELSNLREHGK